MSNQTHSEVELVGDIDSTKFIITRDGNGRVWLDVGLDGAWTTTYHRSVGEALRRLSVEIGEG